MYVTVPTFKKYVISFKFGKRLKWKKVAILDVNAMLEIHDGGELKEEVWFW